MTIVPELKTCPVCHKKYSWNPDLGHFRCPHCGGLGIGKKNIVEKIFGKKEDSSGSVKRGTKESK